MLAVQSLPLSGRDIDIINDATLAVLLKDPTIPRDVMDECYALVVNAAVPKVCYLAAPITVELDRVTIEDNVIVSTSLVKHLIHAKSCYMFAATIGAEIDRLISRYATVSTLKSYVIDRIASLHIESVCDYACRCFADMCAKCLTPRYSPGYGDCDIEYQKMFVSVLDTARKIGVVLTDGGMLTPSKSVTAIAGVCGVERAKKYCCEDCKRDCKNGECIK